MRYHNITKDDMLNGDGLRVVLYPDMSKPTATVNMTYLVGSRHENYGETGMAHLLEHLMFKGSKNYPNPTAEFTKRGFRGGDPLYEANRADVTALAKEIKERYPKKDIWVYTGYEWESVCDLELMDYTDVVVDGRFILAQRDVTLEWKGSPNQRVIDVKKTRARGEVVLFGEK